MTFASFFLSCFKICSKLKMMTIYSLSYVDHGPVWVLFLHLFMVILPCSQLFHIPRIHLGSLDTLVSFTVFFLDLAVYDDFTGTSYHFSFTFALALDLFSHHSNTHVPCFGGVSFFPHSWSYISLWAFKLNHLHPINRNLTTTYTFHRGCYS